MNDYFASEQSVIGSLMVMGDLSNDSAQKVFNMLKPGSFQDARHRAVFDTLINLE